MCFRVALWLFGLVVLAIPGFFLLGLIGKVAGFRQSGPRMGDVERVFAWIGVVVLGTIVVGGCAGILLLDYAVGRVLEGIPDPAPFGNPAVIPGPPPVAPNLPPARPRPIDPAWDEKAMTPTYLSDLPEFGVTVGYGRFGKNGLQGFGAPGEVDRAIRVAGQTYPHALSLHPPPFGESVVKYRLGRQYKLFKGWYALADLPHGWQPEAPCTFCVYGDGALLWASAPLQRPGTMPFVRLGVEGVDVLELRVACHGSHTHAWAVWLEPHVLK